MDKMKLERTIGREHWQYYGYHDFYESAIGVFCTELFFVVKSV